MARYIDAEDFANRMSGVYEEYMWEVLEDTPTADVQEVTHGYWIFWDINRVLCSVCKLEPYAGKGADSFKYCPYCGAKMGWTERRQRIENHTDP